MLDELSPTERLAILQKSDRRQKWRSLNDRRLCVRCANSFTGLEIKLGPQKDGSYRAACPTPGCDSRPRHWLFHGTDLPRGESAALTGEVDFSNW